MVNNLPAFTGTPPDGASPGAPDPLLKQRIGQKVNISGKLPAMEVRGFPNVFLRCSMAPLQFIEHKLPGIARTGRSSLPEIVNHHLFEVCPVGTEFRTMEDRFSPGKFLEDIREVCGGGQTWLDHPARIQAGSKGVTLILCSLFWESVQWLQRYNSRQHVPALWDHARAV